MNHTYRLVRLLAGAAILLPGEAARAQGSPPAALPIGQVQGRQERASGRPAQRALIERRLQDRINLLVRTRLALTDDQFTQLRAVSARMENERRALRSDEMATRNEIRRQLGTGDAPNESRVAELLEQLPRLERRRIDMLEQEQRELARFLQPSQRARYFALQDQLRRELQEGQRRRLDSNGPPGNGPPDNDPKPLRRGSRPPFGPGRD